MKNKLTLIIPIIAIFLILTGSVAYYRIVINGKIKLSTGNAVFVLKDENSNEWNNKKIALGQISPGDSGSFTVTMDASSSEMDMYATLEIDKGSLPTNLKFYTTPDHKSELHKYYSFLEKDGTNKETLTIYWYWNPYIDNVEDNKFINMESMEANVKVNAVQISEYAMMKNGYSSDTTLNGGTEFWSDTYRPYIRKIVFKNNLSNLPSECTEENLCWDISYDENQSKKVYSYLLDTGLTVDETDLTNTIITKPLYNLYIVSDVMIFAPFSCELIFGNFKNLIQIDFNNNFNTSKVTNMDRFLYSCYSLTNIDLSSFNTTNVSNMYYIFGGCTSLESADISNFNTINVTSMGGMFNSCTPLTVLDLSSFNTFNVTDMGDMFNWCRNLTNLNLSSFDTSNVTNTEDMFRFCLSLKEVNLTSFNTLNITNMDQMFYWCESLETLDLGNFNTSNVTNMNQMFSACYKLKKLNLSSFNTSNVTNMFEIFKYCKNLQTEITIMNTNITDYTDMFLDSATESGSKITVNYTSKTKSLVDNMILTKSSNSNVVKGKQI